MSMQCVWHLVKPAEPEHGNLGHSSETQAELLNLMCLPSLGTVCESTATFDSFLALGGMLESSCKATCSAWLAVSCHLRHYTVTEIMLDRRLNVQ